MKQFLALLFLSAAFMGCASNMDPTEEAVLSDKPMSESTGATTKNLNTRQNNDVDGMYEGGAMNQYEEQQMEQAIGPSE